jgi:hypothetical protein
LGWANRARASSTVTERIWSSVSRLRVSLPLLQVGAERPLWATISSPESGSAAHCPGDAQQVQRLVEVRVAGDMEANNEEVRGFGPPSTSSPSCT